MGGVKALTLTLCAAVILASITSMIIPSERNSKIIKLILSVFVLISLIAPIYKLGSVIGYNLNDATINSQLNLTKEKADEILSQTSSATFYGLLKPHIENFGIKDDFFIDTEVQYVDDKAVLKSVNIHFDDLHKIEAENLKQYLMKITGINVNIQ